MVHTKLVVVDVVVTLNFAVWQFVPLPFTSIWFDEHAANATFVNKHAITHAINMRDMRAKNVRTIAISPRNPFL